jgi:hypothetical protein
MNPQTQPKDSDEMRPEYDFSHGVRGKHYKAYQVGTNVVFLDPDIAAVFPDSASVNQALRLLVRLSKTKAVTGGLPRRCSRRAVLAARPNRRRVPARFAAESQGVSRAFSFLATDFSSQERDRLEHQRTAHS